MMVMMAWMTMTTWSVTGESIAQHTHPSSVREVHTVVCIVTLQRANMASIVFMGAWKDGASRYIPATEMVASGMYYVLESNEQCRIFLMPISWDCLLKFLSPA